ncbi:MULTISPECIES: electron transfer flavoprotein-ubiquinone oxidoreductase [unclassified Herbaspirillum]|uniref:electron transfer flavoprotein-ubiquinone oxidoreductase n=1 Tax=unclassified Herbaspirillum TaxID=2624150 RepID=UPI000E2E4F7F|nr:MULTISPECIES: electron transfer flavoprotein-ubiquinone oxidoreductase [unclassified Herbaspirillum]RFB73469.1 electron transfer flavoprotein-ubiquinone oxidoreductase [Herbaspirillum sp. 3R-3a1]TFI10724.1 electron transfer flavoprotein-ubiquinone oxidoreductase [Herbaspirillum sp. 3R11]TFI16631.1 electron transfer flavoprotein-ubiquinone oxidoreductase [Herbaspirillum sp. 3R-11]TFI31725.1 electron transfer flavoprotein-ubiquinone oxidoreductase [Herbaspirillum sp. 3C11]
MTQPQDLLAQYGPREAMEYDVVVVGGGPAGLSSAIRIKQLAAEAGKEVSVCVLEKGSEVGAHILSGAVMDPQAITELFPNWKELGAPLNTEVTEDRFLFLSASKAYKTPSWMLPACFQNHGNYVISLANVTRWLGQQAEALGVEIFPGFAAAEVLYNDDGSVKGVATGNMGVDRHGEPTGAFQLGMELHAKYTFFAEGARGHLGKQLIAKYKLDAGKDPQTYAIGIKEIWEIDPKMHKPGLVVHTAGWPLDSGTYGGSFLYHLENNQVAVGYVVGLAYENPYLSPYEEFQRYKTHPEIRKFFEGGKRLAYGARAITAGGLQSLPKLTFPGGALIGCDAGFLNASRIKGSHAAIKTGMLAAEAVFEALSNDRQFDELTAYSAAFEKSWLHEELHKARNFKPSMSKGLYTGTLLVGIDQVLFGGKAPWTLHHTHADHECLKPASDFTPIAYPKPDGKLTFDRLSSVFISNTNHAEDQPVHLTLRDPSIPVGINLAKYAGPEARYCPAGVYEFVKNDDNTDRLQINAQNCVHCKTCDIKDPTQNIVWVTPEGGGGPNYSNM